MRKHVRRLGIVLILLSLLCLTVVSVPGRMAYAMSHYQTVWLQTMDSCKRALDGSRYTLVGGITTLFAQRSGHSVKKAGIGSGCPAQGGNCSTIQTGCLSFAVPVPASGVQTYQVKQTLTPPPNSANPQGYAPCQGGSACQSQEVNLTINATGLVKATVKNVYPDGTTKVWPDPDPRTGATYYTGTTTDPIVTHNFGLGTGSCDGDQDADDHLTGSPSSHCAYPETSEATVCQPYPWACHWVHDPATGQYQQQ